MYVWLFPPKGIIVKLKWWTFSRKNYETLLSIQRDCPNQVIELVSENQRYVPIHALNLENYRDILSINANT